jgi:hypothetical protein
MGGGGLKKIIKAIKDVPAKLTCGTKFLKNFYYCGFFYIVHLFVYILYLPLKFFFIITKFKELEVALWNVIYVVDDFFSMLFFGFHFVKWPEKILNNCYRCKKKKVKNTRMRLGEKLRKMFHLGDDKFNFTFFLLVMGGAFWFFYMVYYYLLLPKPTPNLMII